MPEDIGFTMKRQEKFMLKPGKGSPEGLTLMPGVWKAEAIREGRVESNLHATHKFMSKGRKSYLVKSSI